MTMKSNEATKEVRVTVKDKAREHIERLRKRGVIPTVFAEVMLAYAIIGIFKYSEAREISDTYERNFHTDGGKQ